MDADALPCGSQSTIKTFLPAIPKALATAKVIVVFPHPPF